MTACCFDYHVNHQCSVKDIMDIKMLDFSPKDLAFSVSALPGEERVWREHASDVGQRSDVAVSARAKPSAPRALTRGGAEAKAEAAHVEEPRLRCELPRQASVAT